VEPTGATLARLIAIAFALAWTGHSTARADYIGSLRLPQSAPPLNSDKPKYDLSNPPPVNSSWAQKGHRPLGVTLDNYQLTAAQIDAVGQTGCGLVRLAIPYEPFDAAMEAGSPSADWAALDQVVSRLCRAGLEVLPVLTASTAPDPRRYQRFCTAIAQRYGPTFHYYQILDNVNYLVGLPSQEYADLLSGVKLALKAGDSDAQLVCGGVRGCDLTYLELLEANGALRSIDVLAFGLYPAVDGIETVAYQGMVAHSLPYMQDVMQWARARGKPVWVTSLGVPTSFDDPLGLGVDQVAQASAYARSALILGYLGVERILYASVQDTDPTYQNPAQCFGLLDVTGAPKASYYALKALAQLADGSYQVAPQFKFQSEVYQRLTEADLLNAATSQAVPEDNPLAEFEVFDMPVYSFWLYNPARNEYRLAYWLAYDPPLQHLLTLTVHDTDIAALEEYQLLDNAPAVVKEMRARNLFRVRYLPLGPVPTVLRFEVRPYATRP
jgi:hypothetical protein